MEDVLAIRDEYRLQEWSQIIQAGQNSGLSKREFCRQNGISERQYYYWLKKLRETVAETASPRLVHLEAPVPPKRRYTSDPDWTGRFETAGKHGRGSGGSHSPGLTATMLDLSRVRNYYVACGYTDLRRGIEGLAAIVTQQFGQEMSEESLFLVLRKTHRPHQGVILFRRWIYPVV